MVTDPQPLNLHAVIDRLAEPVPEQVNDYDTEHNTEHNTRQWEQWAPARYRTANLDQIPDPYRTKLFDWCQTPNANLIITGPVGTGKTHAGLAVARQLIAQHISVEFQAVVRLLDNLRPGGPPGELDRLISVPDVLILDDIGAEKESDWTHERFYALINQRWMDCRPIIATANLEPGPGGSFEASLGERVYSRLCGGAVGVRMGGDDRRRVAGRSDAPVVIGPKPVEPKPEPDFEVALAGVAQAREALKRARR